MEVFYGPQFRATGSSPAPHLIFDGRNLYDPERLAELVPARRGWGRKGAPTAGAWLENP
jgi:hypothetical protein